MSARHLYALAALAIIALLAMAACNDRNRNAPARDSLSVAVSPEFAPHIKPLAAAFEKRFMVNMDVKTVEADRLLTLEEQNDFLIGVEREKAVKAVAEKDSKRGIALWISDDVALAVRRDETFTLRKARDLQQPGINPLALPAQREEVGRRALELFDYWKLRSIIQPRVRITPDSASALKMLKSGQARAAIVPSHLIAADPGVKQAFSFSPLAHQSLRKVALRCPRSLNKSAADEFEHLLGTEGANILMRAGYKASDSDF